MNPTGLSFEYTTEKSDGGIIMRTILDHGTLIVGYSGGADSSCLLHLLVPWCRNNGVRLAALHVNHMIRGAEADSDEVFCRNVCSSLNVELFVRRADVPSYAKKHGMGLEEAAREVRYSFFDEISEIITGSPDGAAVATAHNSDDNLETVIFNLLRGSGTHGLGGIAPVRDGRFVRPLIRDSGASIREWCRENGVDYVVDSTNSDTEYTRNHIRQNIVPEMRKICHSPQNSAVRLTSLVRTDDDFIESECMKYIAGEKTSISRETLQSLHRALSSRILRHLYNNAKSGNSTIEEVHISKILSMLRENPGNFTISLPGMVTVSADRHTISFGNVKADAVSEFSSGVIFTYPDDGEEFSNVMYRITFSQNPHKNHTIDSQDNNIEENIYKLSTQALLCFDKIKGTLKIKYRESGDLYRYGGLTRKVKKLFGDKKLTSEEKSLIPIISDDEGIVWIPTFPPRDGLSAITNKSDSVILITAEKIK